MISKDGTFRLYPMLSRNQGKIDWGDRNMLISLYLLYSILRCSNYFNQDFDKKDQINQNGNATWSQESRKSSGKSKLSVEMAVLVSYYQLFGIFCEHNELVISWR